jgi:hypothetical protein
MKTLFNEKEQWLPYAYVLDNEVRDALRPILERYSKAGYSLRQIQNIVVSAAFEMSLASILDGVKR